MKYATFRCDQCKVEVTAVFALPNRWLTTSFWSGGKEGRAYVYHHCSYACLSKWSQLRDAYYLHTKGNTEDESVDTMDKPENQIIGEVH